MPADEDVRATETLQIHGAERVRRFAGRRDMHLRLLRDAFDVRLALRGNDLHVEGSPQAVEKTRRAVRELLSILDDAGHLSAADVEHAVADSQARPGGTGDTGIEVFPPRRHVRPRTPGQSAYIRSMAKNDLVFCTGPAGTGKTYLAVAAAVAALKKQRVRRIILARPAVEAGEKLGFLPGDMQAKVNPYLRPLYDALQDMMGMEQSRRYLDNDLVEVAPLAYMRGRTLDHAFIILDEGQNCTRKQMKMLLTRLGASSCCVVTGDISQIDLPASEVSGMIEAMHILARVKGIGFVRLSQKDIVRHRLVQDIVDAYEADESATAISTAGPDLDREA